MSEAVIKRMKNVNSLLRLKMGKNSKITNLANHFGKHLKES